MKQVLFVRRGDKIASWKWQRGGLRIAALDGNEWSDFTPAYWDAWKDANQVTDGIDAILLTDDAAGFGALPDWLAASSEESSGWSLEQIARLAADEAFDASAFVLTQGENRLTIGDATADSAASYALLSTCAFALPGNEPEPAPAEEPPPKEPLAPPPKSGMSLLSIKKGADARIAEAKARAEKEQKFKEQDIHPLVRAECDRNVREAYFRGVVFASLADDLQIDEAERPLLARIGNSLAIPPEDQHELATLLQKTVAAAVEAGGEGVFAPLEESVKMIADVSVRCRLFVAEYVKVCGARELDEENVKTQLKDFILPLMPDAGIKEESVDTLYRVVKSGKDVSDRDLGAFARFLGDGAVLYFVLDVLGDVEERLSAERKRLKSVCHDFKKALDELGEKFKMWKGLSDGYRNDIQKILSPYAKDDIDWEADWEKLSPVSDYQNLHGSKSAACKNAAYRKLIWRIVGMLVFAEKDVNEEKTVGLLSWELYRARGWYGSSKSIADLEDGAKSFAEDAFRKIVGREPDSAST